MSWNSVADLLTQTATQVRARAQGWETDGGESLGALTVLYSNIPCLLVPMSAAQATAHGLNYAARPYAAMFEPGRYITRSSAGQSYQEVLITVGGVEYEALGPQVRFGESIGADDCDHVEVPVARRESS